MHERRYMLGMSHPLLERVHRLAVELRDNQSTEKFELCDALSGLLGNISQEGAILSLNPFDEDARLFRQSMRDILQSRLSSEFRRKALNLCAALFDCYGCSWIDSTPDAHTLLMLMTHIACIEIRVTLARKDLVKAMKDGILDLQTVNCICVWFKILQNSIQRLTNDPGNTQWESDQIISLQKCYTQTIQEIILFVELVFTEEDILETNPELRRVLSSAVEVVTFWSFNDLESLEDTIRPLLPRVSLLCARLRWSQICLNLVTRLDLECMVEGEKAPLVAQLWDKNEAFVQFALQCFCADLVKMKVTYDRRLLHVAHFMFLDFESLVVTDARQTMLHLAKALTDWMLQSSDKNSFTCFDAQALFYLGCLLAKFCQVSVEDSTRFKVAVAGTVQVLWTFCGFNKNNRSNTFRMPSVYRRVEPDLMERMIECWCEAVQTLSQMLRKHPFVCRFLIEHRIPHRAVTVPLVGTVEMPESMEAALQEFHHAVTEVCPDVEKEMELLQTDLLLGGDCKAI